MNRRRRKKTGSRRRRLKYAISEGRKAYRRGKESRLTRARKLITGRNATGFAGRVGLLGIGAAGIGAYKIGGNITRSGSNIEKATEAFRNTVRNVEKASVDVKDSTAQARSGMNKVGNFIPNSKKKIGRQVKGYRQKLGSWIDKKKKEGIASRKKRLGFNLYDKYKVNFMKYYNAEFSAEQLDAALEETLDQIDAEYEAGMLTDEEAEDLEADAYDEYEELGDELEDELEANGYDEGEDLEEYAYDGVLANFSAGTAFGNSVMEHIVAADPYDPESTIAELAMNLGLVDEDGYELSDEEAVEGLLGVMSGEVEPDESLIEGISDYLDLNDDEVDEIYELAEDDLDDYDDDEEDLVDADYVDELGDDYLDDETDDYVDELEDEIEGLEDELDEVGDVAEEAFSRVEDMEAEFAEAQYQNEIAAEFSSLEEEAYALVESGQMPPAIFEEHYGNFSDEESQLAAFSAVCDNRGVTPDAELYRLDSLNQTYADMEPSIDFSQFSYSDSTTADYAEDDALLAQAARNVHNRLSSNNFGQPLDFTGLGLVNREQSLVNMPSTITAQHTGAVSPPIAHIPTVANGVTPVGMGDKVRSF